MKRFSWDKTEKLLRLFKNYSEHSYVEVSYIKLGISGLECNIEFPSDWHEDARAWFRLGLGFFSLGLSFPWKWVVPDNYQCSGPKYN